jgi:hypothetical protein
MAKRPRDLNQLAKMVVDIASGEVEDTVSAKMRTPTATKGRAGGLKGGKARAAALSPENRKTIAKQAAEMRWAAKTKGDIS